MSKKEKLVCIVGPTATGKTRLSIDLAKKLNGEIISGDSMQVYRGMDIGTAKVTKEEMSGIPHHLINIKDPEESFSVFEFQQLVRGKISEITNRNRLPMIVGGTGLYIQAVIYDYRFSHEARSEHIRRKIEQRLLQEGGDTLYNELKEIDPETAGKIHPNNERRIIRALEVYYTTGKTMTEIRRQQENKLLYDAVLIGLTMERQKLYERIDQRVDQMMEKGLLQEAKMLYEQGLRNHTSTQAIGYKELFDYFDGKISLDEAVGQIKRNTRRFAKRQLTWFRNKMDVTWFDMTDPLVYRENLRKISEYVAGKLNLKSNT